MPYSQRSQVLNSISSVPGLINFSEPTTAVQELAPRIGIAYSPGTSGKTSIRAGFGINYDVLYDNIGILESSAAAQHHCGPAGIQSQQSRLKFSGERRDQAHYFHGISDPGRGTCCNSALIETRSFPTRFSGTSESSRSLLTTIRLKPATWARAAFISMSSSASTKGRLLTPQTSSPPSSRLRPRNCKA